MKNIIVILIIIFAFSYFKGNRRSNVIQDAQNDQLNLEYEQKYNKSLFRSAEPSSSVATVDEVSKSAELPKIFEKKDKKKSEKSSSGSGSKLDLKKLFENLSSNFQNLMNKLKK